MKIRELIQELQKIENKDRELQILIGNEDSDYLGCEKFELMHTDNCDQVVEIFCNENDCYSI